MDDEVEDAFNELDEWVSQKVYDARNDAMNDGMPMPDVFEQMDRLTTDIRHASRFYDDKVHIHTAEHQLFLRFDANFTKAFTGERMISSRENWPT